MKNSIVNKIILIACICSFLATSCNDTDFLREDPEDFLTTDNAFLNVSQFETGTNQMYSQVRCLYNSADGVTDWVLTGIGLDLFINNRGDGNDVSYNNWNLVFATDAIASRYWSTFYQIIKNSNELLYQTENENVDWLNEQQKNEIQAEIRFFRAYAYRGLANLFGGVPIQLEPVTYAKLDYTRSSRAETYQQAIEDAEFAATHLPTETTQDGRVLRAAADHLLSELYIALSDNGGDTSYTNAIEAASRVIDGSYGNYKLMQDRFGSRVDEEGKNVYWDLFRMGNQNTLEAGNTESIWVAQYEYNVTGGVPIYGRILTERVYWPEFWNYNKFGYDGVARDWMGRGVCFIRFTEYAKYTMWANCGNDIRNSEVNINRKFYAPYHLKDGVEDPDDLTPYESEVTLEDGSTTIISIIPGEEIKREWLNSYADTTQYFFPRFFKFGTDKHHDGIADNGYVPDIYIFRLAETYLLRAEAYLKAGMVELAVADINTVRARSNAPLITASDLDIDYILDERARELIGEEYRFMTLSRMNMVYERTKKYGFEYAASSINEYNNLLPIPQSSIDANLEAELTQNPGY